MNQKERIPPATAPDVKERRSQWEKEVGRYRAGAVVWLWRQRDPFSLPVANFDKPGHPGQEKKSRAPVQIEKRSE